MKPHFNLWQYFSEKPVSPPPLFENFEDRAIYPRGIYPYSVIGEKFAGTEGKPLRSDVQVQIYFEGLVGSLIWNPQVDDHTGWYLSVPVLLIGLHEVRFTWNVVLNFGCTPKSSTPAWIAISDVHACCPWSWSVCLQVQSFQRLLWVIYPPVLRE